MKKRIFTALIALVLFCIAAAALIYTRPLTIEERYPVLELSSCTLISGYFWDGTGAEDTRFTIAPDDPDFDEMIQLFRSAQFKTKLRNLLLDGTKTHRYQDGDFKWEVVFRFEDVLFPTGDVGSGDMMRISNFFGDINLFFDGEQVDCSVKNQSQWLKDVMSIVKQHPD